MKQVIFIFSLCLLAGLMLSCTPSREIAPDYSYYSDYFVFVSDDNHDPLIIPVDINWKIQKDAKIFTELKSWYGTRTPWPIIYDTRTRDLASFNYPKEWQNVPPIDKIAWDSDGKGFRINFSDSGEIRLKVPNESENSILKKEGSSQLTITFSANRTDAIVSGKTRNGWLIHERVRINSKQKKSSLTKKPFSRFHWIPLVSDGSLYLFVQDGTGKQSASRWFLSGGQVKAERLNSFLFKETKTVSDDNSNRNDVPVSWTVEVAEWDLSLKLYQKAGHTGYGDLVNNKKALYRQALVEGTNQDGNAIHGMLELILEN